MVKSRDNPSSIFFWKDYENDAGLRISSLAAQGLWMRLLCIAAKADPYGYVLVNGVPLDATGTARVSGVAEAEVETLLMELERNGVFSRDRKGRAFSRRMVKEKATSEKSRKNGAKGGNPALLPSPSKQTKKSGSVNQQVNGEVKPPYPLSPFPSNTSYSHGGDDSAQARNSPSIFERVLKAIGVNPADPPKPWQGAAAATHILGWQLVHGLTDDEVEAAVGGFCAENSSPILGPASLDAAITAFAKAKRAMAAQSTAPSPIDTMRGQLLAAMGVDPVSGLTGHGGTQLGTQADMAEAGRWLELPGMTPDVICAEITRIIGAKPDGKPPKSFRYFTDAIQRLSGALTAKPLEAIPPSPTPQTKGSRHDRTAFDQTIAGIADRLERGELSLEVESRNPFPAQASGNPAPGERDAGHARLVHPRTVGGN